MSAGGHTRSEPGRRALVAGGLQARTATPISSPISSPASAWPPQLTGSPLDGPRKWLALAVIRQRFGADDRARIARRPARSRRSSRACRPPPTSTWARSRSRACRSASSRRGDDRWLVPRFHSRPGAAGLPVVRALADLADGGHGALLSPLPPGLHRTRSASCSTTRRASTARRRCRGSIERSLPSSPPTWRRLARRRRRRWRRRGPSRRRSCARRRPVSSAPALPSRAPRTPPASWRSATSRPGRAGRRAPEKRRSR